MKTAMSQKSEAVMNKSVQQSKMIPLAHGCSAEFISGSNDFTAMIYVVNKKKASLRGSLANSILGGS